MLLGNTNKSGVVIKVALFDLFTKSPSFLYMSLSRTGSVGVGVMSLLRIQSHLDKDPDQRTCKQKAPRVNPQTHNRGERANSAQKGPTQIQTQGFLAVRPRSQTLRRCATRSLTHSFHTFHLRNITNCYLKYHRKIPLFSRRIYHFAGSFMHARLIITIFPSAL